MQLSYLVQSFQSMNIYCMVELASFELVDYLVPENSKKGMLVLGSRCIS